MARRRELETPNPEEPAVVSGEGVRILSRERQSRERPRVAAKPTRPLVTPRVTLKTWAGTRARAVGLAAFLRVTPTDQLRTPDEWDTLLNEFISRPTEG